MRVTESKHNGQGMCLADINELTLGALRSVVNRIHTTIVLAQTSSS